MKRMEEACVCVSFGSLGGYAFVNSFGGFTLVQDRGTVILGASDAKDLAHLILNQGKQPTDE